MLAITLLGLTACGPGMRLDWFADAGNYAPVPVATPSGDLVTSSYEPYSGAYSVIARDPSDGGEVWRRDLDAGGPVPIPLDDDGNALIGTEGGLVVLDAKDGSELRRVELEGSLGSSLAVDGDRIYGIRRVLNERYLTAIDGAEMTWEVPMDASALAVGRDGTLFVLADLEVHALDPDGQTLWSTPLEHNGAYLQLSRDHVILSSVLRLDTGAYDVVALDRADGGEAWTWGAPTHGTAIADEDTIYAAGSSYITALDEATGTELWAEEYWTGPIALGGDGRIYAMTQGPEWEDDYAPWRYFFSVIDAGDGSLLWQEMQSIEHAIDAINGSPSFDGGAVYFSAGYFRSVIYKFEGGPGPGKGPWTRAAGDNANQRRER